MKNIRKFGPLSIFVLILLAFTNNAMAVITATATFSDNSPLRTGGVYISGTVQEGGGICNQILLAHNGLKSGTITIDPSKCKPIAANTTQPAYYVKLQGDDQQQTRLLKFTPNQTCKLTVNFEEDGVHTALTGQCNFSR